MGRNYYMKYMKCEHYATSKAAQAVTTNSIEINIIFIVLLTFDNIFCISWYKGALCTWVQLALVHFFYIHLIYSWQKFRKLFFLFLWLFRFKFFIICTIDMSECAISTSIAINYDCRTNARHVWGLFSNTAAKFSEFGNTGNINHTIICSYYNYLSNYLCMGILIARIICVWVCWQ